VKVIYIYLNKHNFVRTLKRNSKFRNLLNGFVPEYVVLCMYAHEHFDGLNMH
jgi:hypothetical protein